MVLEPSELNKCLPLQWVLWSENVQKANAPHNRSVSKSPLFQEISSTLFLIYSWVQIHRGCGYKFYWFSKSSAVFKVSTVLVLVKRLNPFLPSLFTWMWRADKLKTLISHWLRSRQETSMRGTQSPALLIVCYVRQGRKQARWQLINNRLARELATAIIISQAWTQWSSSYFRNQLLVILKTMA